MKRIRFFLMAVLAAVSANGFAQPLLDMDFSEAQGWVRPFTVDEVEVIASNGDIFAQNNNDQEKTILGIVFGAGSNGQRINLNPTGPGVSSNIGTAGEYAPETADDAGARAGAVSFIRPGAAGGYMILPVVQGPAQITVWTATGNTAAGKYRVLAKGAAGSDFVQLDTDVDIPANKIIKKHGFYYSGTDNFQIKIENLDAGAGNSNNLYIFDVIIESASAPTAPSILLASAASTTAQSVYVGTSVNNIVYKYGGTATSASVTWDVTPAGITVTPDADAKTVTIAGTPTDAGVYNYSVTATDGTATTEALSGSLTVNALTKPLIAYITNNANPTDAGDVAVINKLKETYDVVIVLSSAVDADLSAYKAVVLAALPGSGDAGLKALKTWAKPLVNLKPFMFQSSRWNWGIPTNLASASDPKVLSDVPTGVAVTDATHPVFAGLSLSNGAEVQLATSSKHGSFRILTPMFSWIGENESKITTLATVPAGAYNYTVENDPNSPKSTDASGKPVIFEFAVGVTLEDNNAGDRPLETVTVAQKNVNIGVSEQAAGPSDNSITYLTAEYLTIVSNAVGYVIGESSSVGSAVTGAKAVVGKAYYDLAGRQVSATSKGILIQKSIHDDGSVSFGKVYVK